jgi:hypothetical protein
MYKKRGQITLFILLGIILLFAFGFLLYIKAKVQTNDLANQAKKTPSEYVKPERLNEYVSSCLDEAAKEGLLLIGLQGGNIYEYQNGTTKIETIKYIPLEFNNISTNVSYGLIWDSKFPDFSPSTAKYLVPFYPGPNLDLLSYYGNNNLSYLCQPNGPNQDISGIGLERLKGETCIFSDSKKSGYGPNSIQEQLSFFISKKLKSCIDLSSIPELRGKVVEQGQYKVSVLLGSDDVLITASIPLKLTEEGTLVNKQLSFSSLQKIRLKRIYEFAHALVELDKKKVKFYKNNMSEVVYTLSNRYKSGFSITTFCPYCNFTQNTGYTNDQIVTITDSNSRLYGSSYVFRFAVENRYPALDNIYTPLHTDKYDYIVGEGQTIKFTPQGYDPDETNLSYNYSGWKEDYDGYFDFSCCRGFSPTGLDCSLYPEKCVKNYTFSSFPRAWTKSQLYIDTKKDASFLTKREDVGFHTLRISVSDKEYTDWQDINILVVDTPVAEAEYYNPYSDVPKSNASIEDPYILNATRSSSIILPIVYYNWKDDADGFSFDIGPVLPLPGPLYNIENIKEGHFRKTIGTINTEPAPPSNLPVDIFINAQGYWKLDESDDDGDAEDSSKNGYDLVKSVGDKIGVATGQIGGARKFEKNHKEYFKFNSASKTELDITGSLTICAWVRPEVLGESAIAGKYDIDSGKRSYAIRINANNKASFLSSNDGTNVIRAEGTSSASSGTVLNIGNWYHICGVYDGAYAYVYLNAAQDVPPVANPNGIKDSVSPFMVGSYLEDGSPAWFFEGSIDEVIVWNKALTPDEIKDIYDKGLGLSSTSNFASNIENKGLKHNITLTVSNNVLNSKFDFYVTVYQCLNHKNPGTASYPYNNLNLPLDNYIDVEDPYQADHTCCENTNTYSSIAKECYHYVEYGGYKSFNPNLFKDLPFTNTPTYPYPNVVYLDINGVPLSYNYSIENDIFERTFSRNCSGARGNVCDGPIYEVRKLVKECNDHCQGPNTTLTVTSLDDIQCMNYEAGKSFEGKYTCSDVTKTCISSGDNGYTTQGVLDCNAALCDGFGNCDLTCVDNKDENVYCVCNGNCGILIEASCDGERPGFQFTLGGPPLQCNKQCQAIQGYSAYWC